MTGIWRHRDHQEGVMTILLCTRRQHDWHLASDCPDGGSGSNGGHHDGGDGGGGRPVLRFRANWFLLGALSWGVVLGLVLLVRYVLIPAVTR